MKRGCGKIVALVGTFSGACNSCRSHKGFARTVSSSYVKSSASASDYIGCSRNISYNNDLNCQCSQSASSYDNNNTQNATKFPEDSSPSNWRPLSTVQYSLNVPRIGGNGGSLAEMSKPPHQSSLFHLRKCSTSAVRGINEFSFRRNYSSNRSKNMESFTQVNAKVTDTSSSIPTSSSSLHQSHNYRHHHLQNNCNGNNSKAQASTNTQARYTSQQAGLRDCNDYCSTTVVSKENNNVRSLPKVASSLSSPIVGGRSANSCGNSILPGASSSSSQSSSSAPSPSAVSPAFGTIAGNGSNNAAGTSNFTSVRTVVTSQRLVEVTRDSIMEQPKLMSKEEREEFMSVYHQLVKELLEIPDMKDMEETNRWMSRVLQYNVPHGKRNRGLSTALAYKYLAPEELTEENVRLSYVLGWCVEILQAFFLVADDIMDGSETRRGRPCWYKVDDLGLAAVNDALLLEATIYAIIRKHFSDKPYYARVMEVMHDVTYKTIFGQCLDTRTGQDRRMETYTMDRYSSIVKYKTSYYSFYLPVALAMTMCEITDPNLFQQMKKVTLEMGHFFQIQDDYLDCFGEEEVTGKIGTDIQDCKCSWLFVVAMQMCTAEQKRFLLDNYGKHSPEQIAAVKTLYKELGLENVYHNYEEQTYNMICTHIQQMSEQLPKGLFYDMLHKIYKRSS